jgi:hypothetical protein
VVTALLDFLEIGLVEIEGECFLLESSNLSSVFEDLLAILAGLVKVFLFFFYLVKIPFFIIIKKNGKT